MKLTWEQFEDAYCEAYAENNMFIGSIEKRVIGQHTRYIVFAVNGEADNDFEVFTSFALAKAHLVNTFEATCGCEV